MTEGFFGKVRGGLTLHVHEEEGVNCRFALGFFGEDPQLLIRQFETEISQECFIIPVFAYNAVPRHQLCSQRSLVAALQTVDLEIDSVPWTRWRELAEEFDVSWPRRLSRLTSPQTKPKAA